MQAVVDMLFKEMMSDDAPHKGNWCILSIVMASIKSSVEMLVRIPLLFCTWYVKMTNYDQLIDILHKYYITECLHRAQVIAEADRSTTIEPIHINKVLAQLLLDFS